MEGLGNFIKWISITFVTIIIIIVISVYFQNKHSEESYIKKINDYENQINIRKGDSLKTSDFLEVMDGHFTCNTASLDKRGVSDNVPEWLNENCIMCNQCSINCPHGVIRPFLLDEEEYNKAPEVIKEKCIRN